MDISRETYVNADERTRSGLQFDLISGLYDHDIQQAVVCAKQMKECGSRFAVLENKWAKLAGAVIVISFCLPFIIRGLFG